MPHAVIALPFIVRGLPLWLFVRVAFLLVVLFNGEDAASLMEWQPGTALGLLLLTVILGVVDVRRRRERVLLGNLGVSDLQLASFFALSAVMGELLLAVILAT